MIDTLTEARRRMEQAMSVKALRKTRGNVMRAAKLLGIPRATFYALLDRLEIKASDYRRA